MHGANMNMFRHSTLTCFKYSALCPLFNKI